MNKKLIPLIIVVVAVVVALFIAKPDFLTNIFSGNKLSLQPDVPLVNDGGTRPPVELPDGPQNFTISSAADVYPRFASAHIDPIKVFVGDRQFMRVVVQNDADVTSVIAEIETDNDTVRVPLKLIETSALSRSELMNQKYLVRDDGVLVINDGSRETAGAFDSFVKKAEAQVLKKFTYEGEWIVRDTHVRTYRTKFIAKDAQGRENSITMAWYDPCSGTSDANSTLSINCTIGSGVTDGVDNGNLTINTGINLQILSGGRFVWNSGKTITLSGTGSITIGGQLVQANLCGLDADKDGYTSSFNTTSTTGSCPGSYVRRHTLSSGIDCYDALPTSTSRSHLAFPGQTAYQTVARGDGSFDYNCDSVASKLTSSYTVCNTILAAQGSCDIGGDCESQCSADGTNTPSCGGGYFTGSGTCQGETDLGCSPGGPGCPAGSRTGNCAYDSLSAATVSCR